MIFSRSKVLIQKCLTYLNATSPNKMKAPISALTHLHIILQGFFSLSGICKGCLCTSNSTEHDFTFYRISLLPHKGNSFSSHTWNQGYFIGFLISPKVGLASIPSPVSSGGAYTKGRLCPHFYTLLHRRYTPAGHPS